MDGLRQYIVSVIAAVMICAMVSSIVPRGIARELVRMIGSTILLLVLFQPFLRIRLQDITWSHGDFMEDAKTFAADGESLARKAAGEIIKSQYEAYILDKASQMGLSLTAQAIVNAQGIPVSFCLTGQVSPEQRDVLSDMLETELGIAKENQQWIG